jgi:hypothetical protein
VKAGMLIQKQYITGKMIDWCRRLKNMMPVRCMILIRRAYFSIYNPAKVLLLIETPATMDRNHNSMLLGCNVDRSEKLPPLVIGICRSPC